MSENFEALFEASIAHLNLSPGALIKANVQYVDDEVVIVSAGLKTDSLISANEFRNEKGGVTVQPGDVIDVIVEAVEDGSGQTRLSREKAKRAEVWRDLEVAFEAGESVIGTITSKVKGGFTVDLDSVNAFLPGSLIDVRPVRDSSSLEGRPLEFKLIKMDKKRSNIVISRRAVVEKESSEGLVVLENLNDGDEIKGIVKNITDYGAFIDLGGVDGLLHITDMSWRRVKHPGEMLKMGDEIDVKVLKVDREKHRVSLGIKQLGEDPWLNIARRYPVDTRLLGTVTNLTDYGCFVELEDGIEGLVHMSEMDWTNKNIHPSKVVNVGSEVEVMVLEIDEERRRISLGIKQCQSNPWGTFAEQHKEGERVSGAIRSITDFGIFIGLEGSIDGLVHLSDISWTQTGEEAVRDFSKGQEIEALILSIDPERERIALGVKQLSENPLEKYLTEHPQGEEVTAKVSAVDAKRALVDLGEGIMGMIRVAEYSDEHIDDLSEHLKVDDTLVAKILDLDKNKQPYIMLTTKKHVGKEKSVKPSASRGKEKEAKGTTLGDLLKEKLEGGAQKDDT